MKFKIEIEKIEDYWQVTAMSFGPIKNKGDRTHALKVWGNDHIVGWVVFTFRDGMWRPVETEVLPSYRRLGIATEMYRTMMIKAKTGPSWEQNEASRALWARLRAE